MLERKHQGLWEETAEKEAAALDPGPFRGKGNPLRDGAGR